MKNKVLIELIVPDICETYDLYIPINRNVIELLNKAIGELSNFTFEGNNKTALYSMKTGLKYSVDVLVRETDIRHGSKLVLL